MNGDTNKEFKVNQVINKKKLYTINKKHKKFVGLSTITGILDRNRVEIKNNKDKLEVVHIKELENPPLLQAENEEDNDHMVIRDPRAGPSSGN